MKWLRQIKPHHIVTYGLRFLSIALYLYQYLVYWIRHPHLTEMQVFLEKWPWTVVGFGGVILAEVIETLGWFRGKEEIE